MMGIIKKELIILFRQPLLYIISALFSLVAGILFYSLLTHYIENIQDELMRSDGVSKLQLITSQLIFPLVGNINFLMMVLAPAICMNSFSEEYKDQTFTLMQSSPKSPWCFISSKYVAYVFALSFILSTVTLFPLILWYSGIYESSFLYLGFIAIFFNVALFTSIGIFCSSLTKFPVLAMFLSYVIILIIWLFPSLKELTDNIWWKNIFDYLSCARHFENIVKGDVRILSLGFYILQIIFFLMLTRISWAQKKLS